MDVKKSLDELTTLRAGEARDFLAIAKQYDGRKSAHLVAARQFHIFTLVDLHFRQQYTTMLGVDNVLQYRGDK